MTVNQIIILVVVILVLGIIVFPLINRRQFINLEPDQQIRSTQPSSMIQRNLRW